MGNKDQDQRVVKVELIHHVDGQNRDMASPS